MTRGSRFGDGRARPRDAITHESAPTAPPEPARSISRGGVPSRRADSEGRGDDAVDVSGERGELGAADRVRAEEPLGEMERAEGDRSRENDAALSRDDELGRSSSDVRENRDGAAEREVVPRA